MFIPRKNVPQWQVAVTLKYKVAFKPNSASFPQVFLRKLKQQINKNPAWYDSMAKASGIVSSSAEN